MYECVAVDADDVSARVNHDPLPGPADSSKVRVESTGIPPEIQSELFQPFVTFGKDNGIGLGLTVVQSIAQQHGGSRVGGTYRSRRHRLPDHAADRTRASIDACCGAAPVNVPQTESLACSRWAWQSMPCCWPAPCSGGNAVVFEYGECTHSGTQSCRDPGR
jgi:Histidine kinase-, DNA gyrase B-, and HSP90-like ATPase